MTELINHELLCKTLAHYGYSDDMKELPFGEALLNYANKATNDSRLLAFPLPDSPLPFCDQPGPYMIHGGLRHASVISEAIKDYAEPPVRRIFDFGCGSGRLLRFLMKFRSDLEFTGCDVNEEVANYFMSTSPGLSFFRSDTNPPLPVSDDYFDVVYAWSIFTHLSEDNHLSWLKELSRITRPKGLILLTITSEENLKERLNPNNKQRFNSKLYDRFVDAGMTYEKIVALYQEYGYVFLPVQPKRSGHFGMDKDNFGNAFISHDYVRKHWKGYKATRVAAAGWQDLVILQNQFE